ncbi:hypothetical protein [Sphingomonas yantingensis]|jgi:phage host-nuclease inhibitor protein Gam|uniref:Phage host-nuclease inhibitor protein Gam n=1 Tax=Sphingomonas yantingensis TaxID=1241761 RepID=A0A7W9EIL3_9SPHN|nr:hypothetical protein [Sphingomonas yantingensis]MBB5699254.1 phage host-nuclease inhibitor protein Gam [Sphingomonas yantingensis]
MNTTAIAFFMIVVGIPVIAGVGGDMFKRWLRHKEAMTTALNAQTAEKAAQYAAQVERLEQRVRVLERIVTDQGLGLSEEIERLRDAPLN